MPNQKPFFSLMNEYKNKSVQDLKQELAMYMDMNGTTRCPVPGCTCDKDFARWGDLQDHFIDGGHKSLYFKAFEKKAHRAFCETNGPSFGHGVRALVMASLLQPTPLSDLAAVVAARKTKVKEGSTSPTPPSHRPKKARPKEEQQNLPNMPPPTAEEPVKDSAEVAKEPEDVVEDEEEGVEEEVSSAPAKKGKGKGAFSQLSEIIRDSDEINKVWRGKVMDEYIDLFHGIPPCLHCRNEEGKQIHHQHPLFHEIILVSLNKLATTAELVMEAKAAGDEAPLREITQEVFEYHMKKGRVLAAPYCQGCNQDAEIKRRKSKPKA